MNGYKVEQIAGLDFFVFADGMVNAMDIAAITKTTRLVGDTESPWFYVTMSDAGLGTLSFAALAQD